MRFVFLILLQPFPVRSCSPSENNGSDLIAEQRFFLFSFSRATEVYYFASRPAKFHRRVRGSPFLPRHVDSRKDRGATLRVATFIYI